MSAAHCPNPFSNGRAVIIARCKAMDATAKPDLRGVTAEQIAAEIAVKVPESQQVHSVADAQPDDGDMWAAVELPAQSPSAVMWASTDDILGAHWDNLGATHGAGGQSVAEGRESELSGVSDLSLIHI